MKVEVKYSLRAYEGGAEKTQNMCVDKKRWFDTSGCICWYRCFHSHSNYFAGPNSGEIELWCVFYNVPSYSFSAGSFVG